MSVSGAFKFIEKFDVFGEHVPSFSLGGRTQVRTKLGAILTMIIVSLTLVFGLVKLQHLFAKKNPTINTNYESLPDDEAVFETNSDDLMLAVAAENYITGAPLTDPRYIQWLTGIWTRIEDELVIEWYPMHKCNEREYERFNKVDNFANNRKKERLRNEDALYCIDERALAFDLYGAEEKVGDFVALDTVLMPCASRVTLFDGSVVGGDDSCIWDQDEMTNYMGRNFYLMGFHN